MPDPTLPESILVGEFGGIRNIVNPERMSPQDLIAATNIDIDDAGQAHRRRGRTQKLAGDFHSVQTLPRGTLAVKDSVIGWILPGYVFVSLGQVVGPHQVWAVQIDDDVYFSSITASGVIRRDDTIDPWGYPAHAREWLSPVVAPTDTLGAVAGKLVSPPPHAQAIVQYRGRIYLADGKTLWVTELFLYHLVDRTKGFVQFEHEITTLAAATDGLYVGTTGGLFFLEGVAAQGLKQTQITATKVLPAPAVTAPANRIHPQARNGPVPEGYVLVLMADDGVYACLDSGQVFNLTRDKMLFPKARNAALLYRELDGVTQVIAALDSGGTPSAAVRFGDYAEAEIRRFQGG